MQDQSIISSLCGYFSYGRSCINSTTMTTLFMDNPLINPLSQLTISPNNFMPTLISECPKGHNLPWMLTPITQRSKDLIPINIKIKAQF